MQAPEDFTIVLSATQEKLKNTPYQLSKFTTNLGSTIKLVGDYKCALTYLHFPKTYYNIGKYKLKLVAFYKLDPSVKTMTSTDWRAYEAAHKKLAIVDLQVKYHITAPDVETDFRKEEAMAIYTFPGKQLLTRNRTADIYFSDALYNDETELYTELNAVMDKMGFSGGDGGTRYTAHVPNIYGVRSRGTLGMRAGIIGQDGIVFPILSEEMQILLGFRKYFEFLDTPDFPIPTSIIDKSKLYSMANFKSTFNYLRVYSNFVKPSFVDNRLEPLLQIAAVPTSAVFGEQIGVSFTPAHYIDVSVSEFNSIDIFISFDGDKPVPLQNGEVIIMLHVKKTR